MLSASCGTFDFNERIPRSLDASLPFSTILFGRKFITSLANAIWLDSLRLPPQCGKCCEGVFCAALKLGLEPRWVTVFCRAGRRREDKLGLGYKLSKEYVYLFLLKRYKLHYNKLKCYVRRESELRLETETGTAILRLELSLFEASSVWFGFGFDDSITTGWLPMAYCIVAFVISCLCRCCFFSRVLDFSF